MNQTAYRKADHPIYRRDYQLPTPPIADAVARIHEVVHQGGTGLSFEGHSRAGKTTFTKYIQGEIYDHANRRIPIFRLTATGARQVSELRFYEQVYRNGFNRGKPLRDVSKYQRALETLFVCEARAAMCKDSLLVIDQAGRWPWEFLVWVSDLQNLVADVGVNMIVILVGRKLHRQRQRLAENKYDDVVARYLHPIHEFRSIKGIREVKKVLHLYDTATAYPPGSSQSFPDFFLANVNLSTRAKLIWETFQLYYRELEGRTPKTWPMDYFSKTIEQLLILGNKISVRDIDEELVRKALARSAFSPTLVQSSRALS